MQMQEILDAVAGSQPVQIVIAVIIYAFYGAVLGLCLVAPIAFLAWAWGGLLPGGLAAVLGADGAVGRIVLAALAAGGAFYIFLISSAIILGIVSRLLSLGIKPGRYPKASLTMLRWLIYSGVYSIAMRLVLPHLAVSYFGNLFFRLFGCRMGKNVYLNSFILNDAYLIELGDNVTIGGNAEISCHLYEGDHLILDRVRIGSGTLVGANAYISPGVEIGEKSVIGLGAYVRRGSRLPAGSTLTRVGGVGMRTARRLEKE